MAITGVFGSCFIPSTLRYLLTSSLLKDGPLSVLRTSVILWTASVRSNFGIKTDNSVDLTNSTSGKREHLSTTTNK